MLKEVSDNITIDTKGKINNLNVWPIINIKYSKKQRLDRHIVHRTFIKQMDAEIILPYIQASLAIY